MCASVYKKGGEKKSESDKFVAAADPAAVAAAGPRSFVDNELGPSVPHRT